MNPTPNRVMLIGDVIYDHYEHYNSYRSSPEVDSPCPVLIHEKTNEVEGGALNVRNNIYAMGGEVFWPLMSSYINPSIKRRILLNGKQICRIDKDNTTPMNANNHECLMYWVEKNIQRCDVLVLSDYNKGAIDPPQDLIKLAIKYDVPVIVDPKNPDWSVYSGATLIKPNLAEYHNRESNAYDIPYTLISKGHTGMELLHADSSFYIEPEVVKSVDPCGCGDSVIATLATYWNRMPIRDLCRLANKAGSIAVTKFGTSIVTSEELYA